MKQIIKITPYTREVAFEALRNAPDGFVLEIRQEDRTLAQNRFYWAMLRDIEEQIMPENCKYTADTWHEYFKTRYLPTRMLELPNGMVKEIERTTTELTKKEFGDYVEQVLAFSTEHGLVWSDEMVKEYQI